MDCVWTCGGGCGGVSHPIHPCAHFHHRWRDGGEDGPVSDKAAPTRTNELTGDEWSKERVEQRQQARRVEEAGGVVAFEDTVLVVVERS